MSNLKYNIKQRLLSPLILFLLLFGVYHLPEFLQRHYQKHLLLFFELSMMLFVVITFFIGRLKNKNGFETFGLFSFRKYKGNLFKGLIIGFSISAIANFLPVWLNWSEISIQFSLQRIVTQTALFGVGTLFPSLAEDILTRGFLKAYYPEKWNIKWLIPFSAIAYTLNHIFRLNKPDVLLYLFILGLVLMWSYVTTGSLWLTLGIHWGSNIAYQFFANLVNINPIKETGLENYLLALCYSVGLLTVFTLYKMNFFSVVRSRSYPNGSLS